MRRPGGGIGACLLQNPFSERQHQPGLLRERKKLIGREQASRWMMPANKCFHAADAAPMTAEFEWLLDDPDDPQRERDGAFTLVFLVFLDDGEFIATQTSQNIGIAKR